MTINLLIIIAFNLFLYLIFYKIINGNWFPKGKAIIPILIGIILVPLASFIEKFFKGNNLISEEKYNLIVAVIEETLKIIPIFVFLFIFKNKKFTFLEILGIGIGFAFLETILYGQGTLLRGSHLLYSGISTTFYNTFSIAFLTLVLRALGALVMHTLTVCMMGITLIYFNNKQKLFIILIFPLCIFIHYLYNQKIMMGSGENFLGVFIVTSILFMAVFSLYIYKKNKNENLYKIKVILKKIGKFILKYLAFFILYSALLVAIDSITIPGIKLYSNEEIEQTKIYQNEFIESSKFWQGEESAKRYSESLEDLSRIKGIYAQINNTYIRIAEKMENNIKLTDIEKDFLESRGTVLVKEINILVNKLTISEYQIATTNILKVQKDVFDYFEEKNLSKNIKSDFDDFKEISNYIINTNKLIISKLELDEELSQDEINYSGDGKNEKIEEFNKLLDKLNNSI